MGCDIQTCVERRDPETGVWERLSGGLFADWGGGRTDEPIDRFYGLFTFLANVRQQDYVPAIHPQRGLPDDMSPEAKAWFGFTYPYDCPHESDQWCSCVYNDSGWFGHSWATGAELLAFDYDARIPCTSNHDGGRFGCAHLPDPMVTLREYLGDYIERFQEIAALAPDPADVRVIYAFDS